MITYADILIFFLVFLCVLYYYTSSARRKCFKNTDVKYFKPPYPIFGSLAPMLFKQENALDLFKRFYHTYPDEKYVGFFEGGKSHILVKDIELLKEVGIKNFENFHDHRNFFKSSDDFFGSILFMMEGDKWKEMRSALSPAFTSSKMKNIFVFVEECAKDMTDFFINNKDIKENGIIEIEVKDTASRYTNDVIATAVFGVKVNSLEDKYNDFFRLGKLANNFSGMQKVKAMGFFMIPSLMKFLNIKFVPTSVSNFFIKIVKESMDAREKTGLIRHDMINLLMEAKKGTLVHEINSKDSKDSGFATVEESEVGKLNIKKKWTDIELTAQAYIFYIAGYETTSTLLTFFFYEMIRNPDIQKKIQEEIDNYIKKSEGKFTYHDILNMKYLDMTISETLRKWPPIVAMDRVCTKSFTFPPPNEKSNKSYMVDMKSVVWLPYHALMNDPKYFSDPDKFDPQRFSDDNKLSINPMTYLPFGVGPRNCIGSRFALMEVKLFIFHLLSKFDLVPVQKTKIPLKLDNSSIQLKPGEDFFIGLKIRFSNNE